MPGENENLIIGLDGDDSKLRKTIDKVIAYGQKKGKDIIPEGKGGGKGQIPKGPSQGSQQAKVDRERQRQEREAQKQGSLKYYGAGRQHTSQTIETGQDLDELKGGGFYGTFERKFQAIKAGKDWIKDRFKRNQEDKEEKPGLGNGSPTGGGLGSSLGGGNNKYQSITISANSVNVNGGGSSLFRPTSGNMPGWGVRNPFGGQPTTPTDNQENPRAGLWSGLAKAAPWIGIPVAIAGGLMQLVSAAGQRYAQAIGKQTGTMGATGKYVVGGGGYFGNTEVAQSSIALGKASGQDIFEKGNLAGDFMQFAAGQGESLSSVMGNVGQLRKAMGGQFGLNELNQMRAYGYKAGFENLRESEFLQGIAQHSEQMRQQGINNNPMAFAAFASSLGGTSMTADRRLGLAGTLTDKSLAGIQGGGVLGALATVKALEEAGGDYFKAERLKDANPEKYMQMALEGLGGSEEAKNIRGYLMKKEGVSKTMTEGMDLEINRGEPGAAPAIRGAGSDLTANENLIDETYVGVGKPAYEFSSKLVKDLAEMTAELAPTIETVSSGLKAIEGKLADLAKTTAETVNGFVESVTEMQESIKAAGGFKEWFKKSVKEALSPF